MIPLPKSRHMLFHAIYVLMPLFGKSLIRVRDTRNTQCNFAVRISVTVGLKSFVESSSSLFTKYHLASSFRLTRAILVIADSCPSSGPAAISWSKRGNGEFARVHGASTCCVSEVQHSTVCANGFYPVTLLICG